MWMAAPNLCNHNKISGHQSVLGLSVAVLQALERLGGCCPLAALLPWRAVCNPLLCFPDRPSGTHICCISQLWFEIFVCLNFPDKAREEM